MQKDLIHSDEVFSGAGNEARTRYLHLGKVALYQMSYARENKVYSIRRITPCQAFSSIFFGFFFRNFGRASLQVSFRLVRFLPIRLLRVRRGEGRQLFLRRVQQEFH